MAPYPGDEGICQHCVASHGLCPRHAKGVLPQLKEPSWYRDAHSGVWTDQKERTAQRQARHANRARNKAKRRGLHALYAAIMQAPVRAAA